ncbi:hypothetical protein Tco_0808778 [Tanacetum coccineum]
MLATSEEMDWVNPKLSINKEQEQFSDLTKPLPMVESRFNWKTPLKRPATVCNLNGIEEKIIRFRSIVVVYDEDAELGIHHWPELRKGFYKTKNASITREDVHSNSKIVNMKHIESGYRRLSLNDIEDVYVLEEAKSSGKELRHSTSGGGQKSLYEQWKEYHYEDPYDDDDFDDPGLTPAQMRFEAQLRESVYGNEVFKFSDGIIKMIKEELETIIKRSEVEYRHGYLNGREWTVRDIRRSGRMINEIERILKARAQMRRPDSYVGGRPKTGDITLFIRPE